MMRVWMRLYFQFRGSNSNSPLQWRGRKPQGFVCSRASLHNAVWEKLFRCQPGRTDVLYGAIPVSVQLRNVRSYIHTNSISKCNPKLKSGTDSIAVGVPSAGPGTRKRRIVRSQDADMQEVLEDNLDKIEELALALRCSVAEVKELVEKDTRLVSGYPMTKVLATIETVLEYGFTSADLLRNPPAFSLSIPTLVLRLKAMEAVRCRKLYVLKFGRKRFREILDRYEEEMEVMGGFTSRETYLAVLLGCSETDILELANQHDYIRTLPVTRLTEVVKLLQDHGFTLDEIRGNTELLGMQIRELSYRLDRIEVASLLDKDKIIVLLHYLNRSSFECSLAGWIQDEEALDGHHDKMSFLKSRLKCTASDMERMYQSCPALSLCRPKRWKEVLDVLLDEMELPTQTVVSRPQVFFFSAKRLRFRHKFLKEKNISDPVHMVQELCLTAQDFLRKYGLRPNTAAKARK